jgi:hypothetical protein
MQTYRNTISSFLVAAMSMYACLLLTDAPVLAQQAAAAAVNQAQNADPSQEAQPIPLPDEQVKRSRKINKRPLLDLLKRVFDLQQRGEIDLNSPLEILIEGDLDAEGLIQNVQITQKSGDAALKPIAEEFVAALNESGTLDFLDEAKRLRLEIASTKAALAVNSSFEAESVQMARQKTQGYKLLFSVGAMLKRGRAEELIYKAISISAKDREVNFDFSMPRETFCALLSKYLSSH